MRNVEYIIVGDGYAALFFAHQLTQNNKSFVIFSDGKKSASQVSAGIVNPVVLKKFTTFWLAQEQLNFLKSSLKEIQSYTGSDYLIDAPIHRIFHDENEQKLWLKKAQTDELSGFLNQNFKNLDIVKNPFDTGQVKQSARLNVHGFFRDLLSFHDDNLRLIKEKFNYDLLDISKSCYEDISFENIVFCEGMSVKKNPYFSSIEVIPNKGHHIKVQLSRPIIEDLTIKKKHFLFALKDNLFFYGGTYDREQTHESIDDSAVEQLKKGLSEFYPYDFYIEEANFGFRPTVRDRRPIVGRHSEFQNMYVFNGLGARGILNGCYFSKSLYNFIENDIDLPQEISLERFNKKDAN